MSIHLFLMTRQNTIQAPKTERSSPPDAGRQMILAQDKFQPSMPVLRFGSEPESESPFHKWEDPKVQRAAQKAGFSEDQITQADRGGQAAYEEVINRLGSDTEAYLAYHAAFRGELARDDEMGAYTFTRALEQGPENEMPDGSD